MPTSCLSVCSLLTVENECNVDTSPEKQIPLNIPKEQESPTYSLPATCQASSNLFPDISSWALWWLRVYKIDKPCHFGHFPVLASGPSQEMSLNSTLEFLDFENILPKPKSWDGGTTQSNS